MPSKKLQVRKEAEQRYYQNHKKEILARSKEWYGNNLERGKQARRKYSLENKKELSEKRKIRLTSLEGCLSHRLSHLNKKRLKTSKVEFDLTFLINLWKSQNGICAISGYPMQFSTCNLFAVSIDRIDSTRGYTKDNVQLVCLGINFCKNRFPNDEMIEFWNYRDKLEENGDINKEVKVNSNDEEQYER